MGLHICRDSGNAAPQTWEIEVGDLVWIDDKFPNVPHDYAWTVTGFSEQGGVLYLRTPPPLQDTAYGSNLRVTTRAVVGHASALPMARYDAE